MNELISRLTSQAGLSQEQAMNAVGTIKEYLTEKFPMLEDMMEKVIGSDDASAESAEQCSESGAQGGDAASGLAATADNIKDKAEDMLDSVKEKASEFLGDEKIENLTEGAKDMAEEAINKLKGMFGGDK